MLCTEPVDQNSVTPQTCFETATCFEPDSSVCHASTEQSQWSDTREDPSIYDSVSDGEEDWAEAEAGLLEGESNMTSSSTSVSSMLASLQIKVYIGMYVCVYICMLVGEQQSLFVSNE